VIAGCTLPAESVKDGGSGLPWPCAVLTSPTATASMDRPASQQVPGCPFLINHTVRTSTQMSPQPGTAPPGRRATRKAAAAKAAARADGRPPAADRFDLDDSAPRPVRVALYIRISTDEEHQPFSLEAQEVRLRSYVGTQPGWELAGPIYRDEKSGATLQRPALQRALTAAKGGKFDILLVYRVDRLARSLRGLVEILDQLDAAGVGFRSATEPVDTSTAVGRMLVQMLGVFAQFERETIIDRVVNGMERKAAKGQWCGGYRPHGYQLDRTTGQLAVVDGEAAVPALIFDLYVRERLGARAVGAKLNERGLRTKTGKPWNADAVLTVLRNRVYLGEVYFRGTWYRAEDHHQPLIDADTFEQAQQILIARSEDHARRAYVTSDYTLAGRMTCQHCGKHYVGTAATGNRYRYRYYTCYTRQRYGVDACPAERLPAEQVEQAVLQALLDTYRRSDLIHQAVTAAAAAASRMRDTYRAQAATIDTELATITSTIDRYLAAFENGTLDEQACGHRISELRQRTGQLRDRRSELAALIEDAPDAPTEGELGAIHDNLTQAINDGQARHIKHLFEHLIHEVRVTGRSSIKPYFRLPTAAATLNPSPRVRTPSGSVPPAGFEPAPPPPEGGALSPELRGPGEVSSLAVGPVRFRAMLRS
jgi:site-specific DNA recombinase